MVYWSNLRVRGWVEQEQACMYMMDLFPLGAGDELPRIRTRRRTPGPCATSCFRQLTETRGAPREEMRALDAPGNHCWEQEFRAVLLGAQARSCCARCAEGKVRSRRTQPGDPAAPTRSAGLSLPDQSLQKCWASLIMDNPPKNEAHQKQRTPFMAQPGRFRGLPSALGDHRGRHSFPGQCFNTPPALHYHSYSGARYSCASNRTN